jgi:hypothetical protein
MATTSGTVVPPVTDDSKEVPTPAAWTIQLEAFKAVGLELGVKSRVTLQFTKYHDKVVKHFIALVETGKRLHTDEKAAFVLEFSNVLLATCGGSHVCTGCMVKGEACGAPATTGFVCGKHTSNSPFNEALGLPIVRRRPCMVCT